VTRPDLATLLERYAGVARPIIRADFSADSCIASTRITLAVCRAFGWRGAAVPTSLRVANRAYMDLLAGTTDEATAEALGAKAVIVGDQPNGDVGHLVAWIHRRYLVDAALDQVERPEFGLLVPGVLVIPVRDLTRVGGVEGELATPAGTVSIGYAVRTRELGYQRAPDWLEPERGAMAVARILAALAHRGLVAPTTAR
jgi:hypothetical protein